MATASQSQQVLEGIASLKEQQEGEAKLVAYIGYDFGTHASAAAVKFPGDGKMHVSGCVWRELRGVVAVAACHSATLIATIDVPTGVR